MTAADVLAAALLDGAERDGLTVDPSLRLLRGARRRPPGGTGTPIAGPAELGPLHERLATPLERTSRGAWYTPSWLAGRLVERALPDARAATLGPVVDPACGGGAFLLAAAERLHELGWPAGAAVSHLRGGDIDPLAVAVTEAALWWWSARRGEPTVAGDTLVTHDALLASTWAPAGTVVGNPPFHGQLRRRTALEPERRRSLRGRYAGTVRAYTDPAWLFLHRAVDEVAVGGRVALVQPRSVLAARDAAPVRTEIDRRASLLDVELPDAAAFDGGVAPCGVLLERRGTPASNDWTGPVADAAGVPDVRLGPGAVLGDLAAVHAGFRDEFYGLAGAVADGGPGRRLVTAGAIDPLRLLDRPQRFAGSTWADPRVDGAGLSGRAARWVRLQAAPKLLVATQTRVIEAAADPAGELVGSVPVIAVVPHDPSDLWRLAAALHAPAASAWLLRRSAGSGLSPDACRPTAALLARLPVPSDLGTWERSARAAEGASRGAIGLAVVARLADHALGVDGGAAFDWWQARRPRR